MYKHKRPVILMGTVMEMGAELQVETSISFLLPHHAHTKGRGYLKYACLLPLPAMLFPACKYRPVVVPDPTTWTRLTIRRFSHRTFARRLAEKSNRPWTTNKNGRVTESGSGSENADGAEKGKENARRNDGLVTGPRSLHVSLALANANETGSVIEIGIVNGTVLENGNEIGIGHLDVVVGMVVRAVRAAEGVGTVEATATGHWPKDWDFEIVSNWDPQYAWTKRT
jgi:hypothetical protein